jgi:glycosyltransferase involved in cell wall biosynthesis
MLKRFVLRGARAVTAVNIQAHDRLVGWGARPQTLTVVPMGVDLAGAHMAGLGARRRKYRIVFVGRLVEKKGVEYLIEAIRKGLAKDTPRDLRLNPATTAIIIGDGPLRAELEAQAKDLPIEFRGQQTQLEVLRDLAKATIAAIPSVTALSGDQEGLPVTLLEAAAAGAFIVASDLPGINEVVVDGETGLLVPPRDATALLRALRTGLERVVFRDSCVTLMSSAVKQFDRAAVGARYTRIITQQVLRD